MQWKKIITFIQQNVILEKALASLFHNEILFRITDDVGCPSLGCCRRSPPRWAHQNFETDPRTRHWIRQIQLQVGISHPHSSCMTFSFRSNNELGFDTLTATRLKMESKCLRAECRNRSEMKPEPFPRALSLSPMMKAKPSASTGWPMRTDSKPREIICQLPHPSPNTSSSSSLTWPLLDSCKNLPSNSS